MTCAVQGATGVGNIVMMGFANGDMMRQNLDSSIGALEVSSSCAKLCKAVRSCAMLTGVGDRYTRVTDQDRLCTLSYLRRTLVVPCS